MLPVPIMSGREPIGLRVRRKSEGSLVRPDCPRDEQIGWVVQ